MPSYSAQKLPALPANVRSAPQVRKTPKTLPAQMQEPSVRVNLPDRTAKLINLRGKKNAR